MSVGLEPAQRNAVWVRRATGIARHRRFAEVGGALFSLAVAIALYTRYSINGSLSRDEAIYTYGGEQFAHGVPPYASIFDPKGPMATTICGFAAALGRLVGKDSVPAIRAAYCSCAVLTVIAVYLLVLRLGRSVVGAVAGAVVFASFTGFARDALSGPDAKMPAVLFAVLAMWLLACRRWFWGGLVGMLACLVWQPLAIYPLIAVVAAVLCAERRVRALLLAVAGAAAPLVAFVLYFAAEGALGKFVESAFVFPLTGVYRSKETAGARIDHIAWVVHHYYGFSGALFWAGLILLLLVVAVRLVQGRHDWRAALLDPLVLVVLVTLLVEAGYATTDFQSYPDLYSLLPYPAVGFGLAVALGARHASRPALRPAFRSAFSAAFGAAVLVAGLVLTGFSWTWFTNATDNDRGLHVERAMACAIERILVPGTPLYALGDPVPLAMTGLRNPDRFVYLDSGVGEWKVRHTAGGFAGWVRQVVDSRPSVIVIRSWHSPLHQQMGAALKAAGYRPGYLGQWRTFLSPAALAKVQAAGLAFPSLPTEWPQRADGRAYRTQSCNR